MAGENQNLADALAQFAESINRVAGSAHAAAWIAAIVLVVFLGILVIFIFKIWGPLQKQHSALVKDFSTGYEMMKNRAEKAENELREEKLKYETTLKAAKDAGVTQDQLKSAITKARGEFEEKISEIKKKFEKKETKEEKGDSKEHFSYLFGTYKPGQGSYPSYMFGDKFKDIQLSFEHATSGMDYDWVKELGKNSIDNFILSSGVMTPAGLPGFSDLKFVCDQCKQAFPDKAGLDEHSKSHKEPKK